MLFLAMLGSMCLLYFFDLVELAKFNFKHSSDPILLRGCQEYIHEKMSPLVQKDRAQEFRKSDEGKGVIH